MGLVRDWMESMRSWLKEDPSLLHKNHEHTHGHHGQKTSQKNPLVSPESKLSKEEMLTNRVLLVMRYGSVTKVNYSKTDAQNKVQDKEKEKEKVKPKRK